MGDRTPFVVGLLAIAGIVAWLLLRDDDTPAPNPARPAGSADLTRANPRTPEPALPSQGWGTSGPRPELPTPPAPTAEDVFSEEPRDDAWADKTEADLAKRWKQIRGAALENVECHQSQCRVIVTGAESAVSQTVADLDSPRGMHGFAKSVHLTSPEKRADGSIALRIFVRFER